jgi:hypothetical protein
MMNEADDINALKIAQYLEDGMSPGEERTFMEELNRDEVLRKSFEEVLLLREVLGDAASSGSRVVSLFRVRGIAAACVAIILVVVGVARLPVFEHAYVANPGDAVVPRPDEVSRFPVNSAQPGLMVVRPDSLFAEFYSVYVGEKDPVEISLYYQRYRAGDYASVLAAREDDYRLMGTGGRSGVLNQYMQLYRGLSYLAERQPVRALGQFDSLLNSPHVGKAVYCSAQWYTVLASLQRKDISADSALAAAARGARVIGQTASPYRQRAAILSGLLPAPRP